MGCVQWLFAVAPPFAAGLPLAAMCAAFVPSGAGSASMTLKSTLLAQLNKASTVDQTSDDDWSQ